ncbi:MAG: DNA gyrase inhibitor YacG [Planctomycetota bacterium]|nr:DNA gyrase inhibitor YacG [Planctomycetota bacterium]GIK52261.1 MAG: DNA gyrase inhibitor YacG [Planctomycetota bacterium]
MACNPKARKCPECGARFTFSSAGEHPWFPFCSERCKLLDLGRWLKGEYAITEDLSRGQDLREKTIDLDDPDVKAALDET